MVSYLFQPLHVFEVESNVKKAEIRIYKLKLQERRIKKRHQERKKCVNMNLKNCLWSMTVNQMVKLD